MGQGRDRISDIMTGGAIAHHHRRRRRDGITIAALTVIMAIMTTVIVRRVAMIMDGARIEGTAIPIIETVSGSGSLTGKRLALPQHSAVVRQLYPREWRGRLPTSRW
jgi:hypothetical protein